LNSLFCLKSLELPYEKTLKDFEECLALYKNKAEIPGILTQYQSFTLRRLLQAGELKNFDSFVAKEIGQPLFQKLWFYRLPYHRYHRDIGGDIEGMLTSQAHFFQKYYRVRTLQSVMHPEDKSETRLSDLVDRLYLWTWDWLVQPEERRLVRVMSTLAQIRKSGNFHLMTAEDYQLLSLAMGWIGLFDSQTEAGFNSFLSAVSPEARKKFFPLFELEQLAQSTFRALRDGEVEAAEDFRLAAKAHTLFGRKDLFFAQLLRLKAAPGLEKLMDSLRRISPPEQAHEAWLEVDLRFWTISAPGKKSKIESEPMARAFRLLSGKGQVEAMEFNQFCFGNRSYDPATHLPKVYNLLARMKKLLPEGVFLRQKGGIISVSQPLKGIHFTGDLTLADRIRVTAEAQGAQFKERIHPAREKNHGFLETLLKLEAHSFTRGELESRLGISRASCNRLICAWESRGLVRAKGGGRSTNYQIIRPSCSKGIPS
jgi:hypothetical protein